jgi:hypothetical protein
MNLRASNIPTAYRLAVAARILAAVVLALGILLVGYSAPLDRVYAAEPAPRAVAYGNGTTGYFPDLIRSISSAAESTDEAAPF